MPDADFIEHIDKITFPSKPVFPSVVCEGIFLGSVLEETMDCCLQALRDFKPHPDESSPFILFLESKWAFI